MPSINKVILIGYIGQDPDIRALPDGDAVVNLSLATTDSWRDKQTGQKREETTWHKLIAFRKLAEICGQYVKKGSLIYCEGKLKTKKYTGKDGVQLTSTSIILDEIRILDKKEAPEHPPTQPKENYTKNDYLNKNISLGMPKKTQYVGFDDEVSF